jgi:predicted nuclease of predicted toxin-antitoxin system
MPVSLYMDVHIPRAISNRLRRDGVDILTAQEDGTTTISDAALLDRATALSRVLVTFDSDLLIEAHRRQQASIAFLGVVYVNTNRSSIGEIIAHLELLAMALDEGDLLSIVEYLPL